MHGSPISQTPSFFFSFYFGGVAANATEKTLQSAWFSKLNKAEGRRLAAAD